MEPSNGAALRNPENFIEVESCILCSSTERTEMFREEPFAVVKCSGCGLVYVTPRLKPEVLPEVYDAEYWRSDSPKERGYADYRRQASLYLKTFRKRFSLVDRFVEGKGRALDVGCAAGFFLKVLQDHGWEVAGVELSPEIARHARESFGFDQIHVGELATAPYAPESFDLITMWDVVEHVPEPEPFLAHAVRLLKPDGCLILETQNVDSGFAKRLGPKWHHYKHLEHLYHFNPATIKLLLARVGLEIVHATSKYGGKHVSVGFIRERATRLHPAMRVLLLPLVPLSGMSFYVNVYDEMIVIARRKKRTHLT